MNIQTLRVIVAAALLLHGIAHVVALFAVAAQAISGPSETKIAIRSWLLPALKPKAAAFLALPFWALSAFCFLAASAAFWGLISAGLDWRQLATAGAIISLLGVALFPTSWPGSLNSRRSMLDTSIAVAFNLVILLAIHWFHWPAQALFGR
jgi:hypothetical protein